MSKRLLSLVTGAVITLLALTSYGPIAPASAAQPQAQPGCQTFKETGKTVCGKFLDYWKSHGDVAQQGFPISNEFKEVSDVNGKEYTVQYFERAVFELHPENAGTQYEVLLSLLGTMFYKQKYPNGATEMPPDMTPQPGMQFPETGKEIKGPFLEYWKSHGGLAQQGYPISNRVFEKNQLDGKEYVVQYFERAVFELHPELAPPYNVLLSQLGTFRYKQKYPGGSPANSDSAVVAVTYLSAGQWGGKGVSLLLDGKSIVLDFDCANGSMNGTSIGLDAAGRFDMQGLFAYEGGPSDQLERQLLARYTGTVKGNIMSLTITVTDQSAPGTSSGPTSAQVLGPYTLTLNAQPQIHKCL